MPWPDLLAFHEAVQNPRVCFDDADLRGGTVSRDAMGLPKACAGNFAAVYQVRDAQGRDWAVKCFTREVPDLQQRYRAVSAHLRRAGLPSLVDFDYLPKGVLVQGRWYPVLKMGWVRGALLNEFVSASLDRPTTLTALAGDWLALARELRSAGLAHGDLQHGNVLLLPHPTGASLRLIDYDGVFVPALANSKCGEVGHPNFQHPRRGDAPYHAEVDRFAHLVIFTALRCLAVEGRRLWGVYDNGDNLLFREKDFQTPASSPLLRELWRGRDASACALAGHLLLACQGKPGDVPLLDDLPGGPHTPTLTPAQRQRVEAVLGSGSSVRPVPGRKATPAGGKRRNPPPSSGTAPKPSWLAAPAAPVTPAPAYVAPPAPRPRGGAWWMVVALLLAVPSGFLAYWWTSRDSRPETVALAGHTKAVTCVAFGPDGKLVLTGSADESARLWDARTGRQVALFAGHKGPVECVAFGPDGKLALTGSVDRTARLWDVATGKEKAVMEKHTQAVTAVAFGPDGKYVVTASHDKTARVWDAATEYGEKGTFANHKEHVSSVAFLDAARVVTTSWDGTTKVWSAATQTEEALRRQGKGFVNRAAFDRDRKRLVAGGRDDLARVWDADSGELLCVLKGHTDSVECVALSPDGTLALTGSLDRTAKLWDATTGRLRATLAGHTGHVVGVAFGPDGTTCLTAGGDAARLWDARTGEPKAASPKHAEGVTCAAFAPDGGRVATGSADGTARVWHVAK